MSIHTFVKNFVRKENEMYEYSKKERKGLSLRLERSVVELTKNRERSLRDQIYYLRRRNHKLETNYNNMIAQNSVDSITKTIENEINEADLEYDNYREGMKIVTWSAIRMLSMIYLSLVFVYFYDRAHPVDEKNMLEWK